MLFKYQTKIYFWIPDHVFQLSEPRAQHCSISLSVSTMILTGGDIYGFEKSVTEYDVDLFMGGSVLGDPLEKTISRQLPPMLKGRSMHACGRFVLLHCFTRSVVVTLFTWSVVVILLCGIIEAQPTHEQSDILGKHSFCSRATNKGQSRALMNVCRDQTIEYDL